MVFHIFIDFILNPDKQLAQIQADLIHNFEQQWKFSTIL